jgi:hypothetical protein
MPPLVLFLIPLAALTVGAVLISIGRRGRAIDHHPICKQCGFDLFGLAELIKCPECGAELSARTIRLGHRRVRKVPLIVGLVLALPSLALIGLIAVIAVRQTDLNRYKPLWLLLREADRPALLEIGRRFTANQLSRGQVDRVTAAALLTQANTSTPFLFEWGNFIEMARAAGQVDDPSWKRYAEQALPLQLVARANVRRGDPVPIRFRYGPARVGRGYQFRAEMAVAGATLGAAPLGGARNRTNFGIDFSGAGTDLNTRLVIPPERLGTLVDGSNPLKVSVRITIEERWSPPLSSTYAFRNLTSCDVETSTTVNLVAADQPTVEVVPGNDAAMRLEIESLLALKGYREPHVFLSFDHGDGGVGRDVHIGKDHWGNDRAEFLITPTRPPPVGLAYDVTVIDRAGRKWPSDTITIEAGARGGWVCNGDWDGFNADRVEVVLTPNPAAAAATVDIVGMFGGVIRFKDVPVVWDKDVHRPTTMPTGGRTPRPPATTATTTAPATTRITR